MKQYPVKKNQQLDVEIIDLTHEGLGIAKIEGYPIFIENALPNEKAQIHIVKVGSKFAYGKVIQRYCDSPERVVMKDMSLLQTGIASLQHMTYEAQLLFKQKQVENVLKKIAKVSSISVEKTLGMNHPYGYRNKAQIPVRKVNGQLATGFFRKNSHDLIEIENFAIQDPVIDQAIVAIRAILRRFSVKPYNESDHTGNLRQIIIRRGHYSHEMMVIFVTRTEKIFQIEKIIEEIRKIIPSTASVIHNINPDRTNVIMGKKSLVLFGQPYIEDRLLSKTYRISAHSFYQVNTKQAEVLYEVAMNVAALKKSDIVIDAYCGIGTIGLSLADQVEHVYGVEVVKDAIEDAKINATLNQVDNITFQCGKAEAVMTEWHEKGIVSTVLVVDPPRKGLSPSFMEASVKINPEKIVYISCNPATMARDIKWYQESGYHIKNVQPVDLFPQTYHVECVTLLVKNK